MSRLPTEGTHMRQCQRVQSQLKLVSFSDASFVWSHGQPNPDLVKIHLEDHGMRWILHFDSRILALISLERSCKYCSKPTAVLIQNFTRTGSN